MRRLATGIPGRTAGSPGRTARRRGGVGQERLGRRAGRSALGICLLAATVVAGCSDGGEDGAGDASTSTSSAPAATTTTTAEVPAAAERDLEVTTTRVPELPGHDLYRPVDLGATGAPLPVVTWGNGGCVRTNAPWAALLERWARAGFVVIAVGTPDGEDPAGQAPMSADDQAAAIDWAEAANETAGGEYEGKLDLDRVVAAGNSCGGITALTLTARDDRVAAAFVLSGSSTMPGSSLEETTEVMTAIDVPVAWVVGGTEDIAAANARQDFDLVVDGVPALLVHRDEGDHLKISTDAALLAEVAEISTRWLDAAVNGNEAARAQLLDDPCPTCDPGTWTTEHTNLDALP